MMWGLRRLLEGRNGRLTLERPAARPLLRSVVVMAEVEGMIVSSSKLFSLPGVSVSSSVSTSVDRLVLGCSTGNREELGRLSLFLRPGGPVAEIL